MTALSCIVLGSVPDRVSAITAEVARKCNAPPNNFLFGAGKPGGGHSKGSGRDQHAYFYKCVANGGKMDDATQ